MKEDILRLTNIAYKILEFFPESDPIKNRAKDKALEIMSKPDSENIDILLGYFWIAKCQGWISSINYLIIANEYEKLAVLARSPVIARSSVISAKAEIQSKTTILDSRLRGNDISDRQKKILVFLENNEKAQVMDLQKVLPNITKRTIRRDLDELLKAGRVARFGEFNHVFYKISR